MKPELARKLAIKMAQIMERYDYYGYNDMLGDYDDNEELMLEDLVGQIMYKPEIVFNGMLNTMEQMVYDIEMR